jgi:hypothetical protein
MSRAVWHEAWEVQQELWRFWTGPHADGFARGWVADWERKKRPADVSLLAQSERAKLYQADPIGMSHDMFKLIEHHAPAMPPEPLIEQDLFTPAGFLLLPEPVEDVDAHGLRINYRALAWAKTTVLRLPDSLFEFMNAMTPEQSIETRNRWLAAIVAGETADVPEGVTADLGLHLSIYTNVHDVDDYTDPEMDADATRLYGTPWQLLHVIPIAFNSSIWTHEAVAWQNPTKLLRAFLRIADQKIGKRTQQAPPRASRKRAVRMGLPEKDYITVVTLRRERTPTYGDEDAQEGGREYTHRWWVDAYWRRTWYASQKRHRWQLVAGSVRGPEDKPFIPRKKRAFQVKR